MRKHTHAVRFTPTAWRTYVSVEPFHLFRYLDEQSFRYNNRLDMDDYDRCRKLLKKVTGKRVTYSKLTGKEGETTAF